jgi:hypothetical protein
MMKAFQKTAYELISTDSKKLAPPPSTTRNVAICDDLLVMPLTFITKWYVICDEISIFVIGAK